MLTALAEPNRLRIVEVLGAAPRTIGEIASALDLRQPQVTKHVQTLERAGLVEVSALGRRRLCSLRRPAFEQLARWVGELAVPGPDDAALAQYRAAIASADPSPITVRRTIAAGPTVVWRAFTDPTVASRWWHPRHFTVDTFRFDVRVGGAVELVLREGNGDGHYASGRVHAFDPLRHLHFTLDPLDPERHALFTVRHEVRLAVVPGGTEVELTVTPTGIRQGAEATVAGLEVGWNQLLDNLSILLRDAGLGRAGNAVSTRRR
jgi:uncharacterized protein YndB with AHSA1/START domain/DNA-binding transcriptional ArsR family regulator